MTVYYVNTPANRDRLRDAGYLRRGKLLVNIVHPVISADHCNKTFKVVADLGITKPMEEFHGHTPVSTPPEYPHLNLYKNTQGNQEALFALGYSWVAGAKAVQNLHLTNDHIKANTTSKRFCLDTVVYAGHKVYEYVATGPESVKERFPALTKSALKLPNDYEFIARSLTTEQWKGFCLGNIINDKLNSRETENFFGDVFNKYKDLCHA